MDNNDREMRLNQMVNDDKHPIKKVKTAALDGKECILTSDEAMLLYRKYCQLFYEVIKNEPDPNSEFEQLDTGFPIDWKEYGMDGERFSY
jgi:hypothetical protein